MIGSLSRSSLLVRSPPSRVAICSSDRSLATAGYASIQGWILVVPVLAVGGGVFVALLLGALAGLYPAVRAARLAPAAALRSV